MPKGEDWDGFKKAMRASSIADKDLILRVLEMYSDKNKREEEIKNIAKTYKEIEEGILPDLRRSQVAVTYTVEGYTDEELMDLCKTNPEALTVEELLCRSATLFEDANDQLEVYQNTARVHADDFRGHNNVGSHFDGIGPHEASGRSLQRCEVFGCEQRRGEHQPRCHCQTKRRHRRS